MKLRRDHSMKPLENFYKVQCMNNQEKIRQLYKDGILTKEEMEAELRKAGVTSKKTVKSPKIVWTVVAIIVVAVCIMAIVNMNKPNKATAYDMGTGDVVEVEEPSVVKHSHEGPQWEITEIAGSPAVQTEFHSSQYGILRVAYSPENGFRFGVFDGNLAPKTKDGMMIGYIKQGDEFAKLIIPDSNDGQYIYFSAPSLLDALDSGEVECFTIERMNDDCSRDETIDYRWYIRLQKGELSKMANGL